MPHAGEGGLRHEDVAFMATGYEAEIGDNFHVRFICMRLWHGGVRDNWLLCFCWGA
jgi:hypothetical protein